MRTKELEVQFHMSRFEREKKHVEAEANKARHLQAQVQAFTKTETELRNQLNVYVDKFKQVGLPYSFLLLSSLPLGVSIDFIKQVEDTLNNSNDLFLSFRKEMEDMSKKGKRLEKDNESLKKQKDASTASILRMAEERQEWKKRSETAQKQLQTLRSIIQAMQKQGRPVPPSLSSTLESCFSDSHGGGEGDEESGYSDEGEDDEDDDEEEDGEDEEDMSDFDDDTEEEAHPVQRSVPVTYGPERPPQPQAAASVNGH